MDKLSSSYTSSIYTEFKDLTGSEPRALARFYEKNHKQIQNLELLEYFDLQVLYLLAIFELGSYHKLLGYVDEPIESCIRHNIVHHNSKDVFQTLLFLKGESYFHTMQFDKARHIFLELLHMDNTNVEYKEALGKTMRKIVPATIKNTRALSILFFIFSAIVIAFEVLAVKHFFDSYTSIVVIFRNLLFALGWITLVVSELYHYYKVQYDVETIISLKRSSDK